MAEHKALVKSLPAVAVLKHENIKDCIFQTNLCFG